MEVPHPHGIRLNDVLPFGAWDEGDDTLKPQGA